MKSICLSLAVAVCCRRACLLRAQVRQLNKEKSDDLYSPEMLTYIYATVLKCMHHLAQWTTKVWEQAASSWPARRVGDCLDLDVHAGTLLRARSSKDRADGRARRWLSWKEFPEHVVDLSDVVHAPQIDRYLHDLGKRAAALGKDSGKILQGLPCLRCDVGCSDCAC